MKRAGNLFEVQLVAARGLGDRPVASHAEHLGAGRSQLLCGSARHRLLDADAGVQPIPAGRQHPRCGRVVLQHDSDSRAARGTRGKTCRGTRQAVDTGDHLACSRPVPRMACASSSTAWAGAHQPGVRPAGMLGWSPRVLAERQAPCRVATGSTQCRAPGLDPRLSRAQLQEQNVVMHGRGGRGQ